LALEFIETPTENNYPIFSGTNPLTIASIVRY